MSGTVQRIANRGQLDAACLAWLENRPADGETAALLGLAVGNAEAQMRSDLRVRCMVQRVKQAIDGRYVTLPCDWVETIDVRMAGKRPLLQIAREEAASLAAGGAPSHFAIVGDQLEILPDQTPSSFPPGTPAELELAYYAAPAPLLLAADTNLVLTEHPAVYLYGTLLHTAMLLRDDDRIQRWAGLYTAARDLANLTWQQAQWRGSTLNARIRAA